MPRGLGQEAVCVGRRLSVSSAWSRGSMDRGSTQRGPQPLPAPRILFLPCVPSSHRINFFTSMSIPQERMFSVLVFTVRLSSQTAPGNYSGSDIQSILICRIHICSFTYWLTFICNSPDQYLWHFCRHLQSGRSF